MVLFSLFFGFFQPYDVMEVNVMRRLILVAALVLAILAGSTLGGSREVAAAGGPYSCTAKGPNFVVVASGLTQEQAEAFEESYEAQGASVKCKKKPSAVAISR